MKVLILGAAGQLGRALLASAPSGWQCRGFTRQQLDLRDADEVCRVVRELAPDWVVNAAAYTQVDRAERDEEQAFAINAEAVRNLAAALDGLPARLVHVSTDFVFDGESSRAYQVNDERQPLSVYGRSKAKGEDLAGDDALIVRTAWLYGASGANFLQTMLRLMKERGELAVVADQIGSPTWVDRLAEVIWGLAAGGRKGVYHYSDAGVASWYDFAVAIAEEARAVGLLDRPVSVTPIATAAYPTAAHRPRFSLLDSAATLEATRLPPVHWRVNLRSALEQVKASGAQAAGSG